MASSSSGGTSKAFLPRTCAARDAGHFGCTFGSPPGVPGGGITGIDLAPVLGAGFTIPGSVFAVDAGGATTPFDRSSRSLSEGPGRASSRTTGGAAGCPWSAWALAWGGPGPAQARSRAATRRGPSASIRTCARPLRFRYGFFGLARRSTGPGRRTRPGLGHALGQLARIGAVARPAPAGLATALRLALAGLGHALRDLLLAGLVLLARRHGTLLYPEGRARRSGLYSPPLATLLLRRPRGRDDRAAPAGPDSADPGRPRRHGGGRRWRLVERLGLGRDVVPRHRLDVLLGHVLGEDAALGPDLDPVEVERHALGADAEEAAARDHELLDLPALGVDDGVLALAERLAVPAPAPAAVLVGG